MRHRAEESRGPAPRGRLSHNATSPSHTRSASAARPDLQAQHTATWALDVSAAVIQKQAEKMIINKKINGKKSARPENRESCKWSKSRRRVLSTIAQPSSSVGPCAPLVKIQARLISSISRRGFGESCSWLGRVLGPVRVPWSRFLSFCRQLSFSLRGRALTRPPGIVFEMGLPGLQFGIGLKLRDSPTAVPPPPPTEVDVAQGGGSPESSSKRVTATVVGRTCRPTESGAADHGAETISAPTSASTGARPLS